MPAPLTTVFLVIGATSLLCGTYAQASGPVLVGIVSFVVALVWEIAVMWALAPSSGVVSEDAVAPDRSR